MKPYVAAVALLAGSLMTTGTALGYHLTSPSPSYEELERNEFQHILQGQRTGHVGPRVSSDPRAFAPSRPARASPRPPWTSTFGYGGY